MATAAVLKFAGIVSIALLLTLVPAAAQEQSGMSGATFALIVAVLVLLCATFGGYFIYAGKRNQRLAKESETWPTVDGTVLRSEVKSRIVRTKQTRSTTYTPAVTYRYAVGGSAYESSVIRFSDLSTANWRLAEDIVAKYPQGNTVSVRYDPASPSRATLETVQPGNGQVITGILFIVVPLLVAAIGAIVFRPSHDTAPPAAAAVEQDGAAN